MAAADDESAAAREAAIASFAQKFPIDERAKDRLRCLPEDTLRRVFDDFRPAADSNPDFSRRLVGFLKGFNTGAGPPARNPFASLGPSLVGGGSSGLVQSSTSSVPAEQLELFRSSYPMDARAFDFLKIVPAEVQARVITTFKPPAVQADYSRIVTAHIRFCLNQHREQQQLVSSHSVASLLGAQQQASAASLLAGGGGVSSLLGGLGGTQLLASVLAQTPGLAHLLAGGAAMGYAQSAEAAEAAAAVAAIAATAAPAAEVGLSPEQLELFRSSYPMDARAFDFLKIVPPEVQQRVVSTFKPPAVQADYSKIVTSHIRFCLNQHREQQSSLQAASAPLLGGLGSAALLAQLGGVDMTTALAAAASAPQDPLSVFRAQYPMDERAFDYLRMAPPEVQQRVISSFNPPAVQSDYSKLVTSHVKISLLQQREQPAAAQQTAPQGAGGALALAEGAFQSAGVNLEQLAQLAAATQGMASTWSGVSAEEQVSGLFALTSGADATQVKQRASPEFCPPNGVEGDYAKAVTAYVRRWREDERGRGLAPGAAATAGGPDLGTLLLGGGQAWTAGLDAGAFAGQAAATGLDAGALTGHAAALAGVQGAPLGVAAGLDLSALLGQGAVAAADPGAAPGAEAAASSDALSASLSQLGGLAALIRAQAATAAALAPPLALAGAEEGSAAKRLRTDVGPSSSLEQAVLALTGAHLAAA